MRYTDDVSVATKRARTSVAILSFALVQDRHHDRADDEPQGPEAAVLASQAPTPPTAPSTS